MESSYKKKSLFRRIVDVAMSPFSGWNDIRVLKNIVDGDDRCNLPSREVMIALYMEHFRRLTLR